MIYCQNKTQLVQSVKHLLQDLKHDLPWTMTIKPDMSEGYYVFTAIVDGSESTGKILSKPSTTT